MSRIWDGDDAEYFRHSDMNRVEYNANAIARELGVSEVEFIETTRASQFRYDEANKLEALIQACGDAAGVDLAMDTLWSYNRSLSYVDFERWEASIWAIYSALGGTGERIPADKVLVTYSATLPASAWLGGGPYHITLDAPAVHPATEAAVYVAHTATVDQRMSEWSAVLRTEVPSDRKLRIWALGAKPSEDLPIRISLGGLPMHEEISLTTAGWTGSGPWTQDVTLTSAPANAVIGQHEGMTDAAVEEMARTGISVSAVSGTTVTIRAIFDKPTIALNPVIVWETSETE